MPVTVLGVASSTMVVASLPVITGASFVPVIVTVTVDDPPSLVSTVKVSVTTWPASNASLAAMS